MSHVAKGRSQRAIAASLLKACPYRVECKWPSNSFFEIIAAFDSQTVALNYARDCAAANPPFRYRVIGPKEAEIAL
jgi:hypothetical protein